MLRIQPKSYSKNLQGAGNPGKITTQNLHAAAIPAISKPKKWMPGKNQHIWTSNLFFFSEKLANKFEFENMQSVAANCS